MDLDFSLDLQVNAANRIVRKLRRRTLLLTAAIFNLLAGLFAVTPDDVLAIRSVRLL